MGGKIQSSSQDASGKTSENVWGVIEQYAPDFFQKANDLWENSTQGFNNYSEAGNQAGQYGADVAGAAWSPWTNQAGGGASAPLAQDTYDNLTESLKNSLSMPSQTGQMYQDIVGGPGNTYADPLADQMARDTETNLRRNVLKPLRGQASQYGQSGSDRYGIKAGTAVADAENNLASRQADMRERNYETDMKWKMDVANRADAGIQSAQDRALGLINNMDESQQYAANQAQDVQNLGLNAMKPLAEALGLPFDKFGQMMQSLGINAPTILSEGESESSGNSMGMGGGKTS